MPVFIESPWTTLATTVHLADNGETVAIGANTMTAGGEKARVVGGLDIDDAAALAAYLELREGSAAPLSTAIPTTGRIRYNAGFTNTFQASVNGGPYVDIAVGAASPWVDVGASVVLVDPTDAVGIGTGAPTAKLQVVGDTVGEITSRVTGVALQVADFLLVEDSAAGAILRVTTNEQVLVPPGAAGPFSSGLAFLGFEDLGLIRAPTVTDQIGVVCDAVVRVIFGTPPPFLVTTGGRVQFRSEDSGGASQEYAAIDGISTTATAGAEVGALVFRTINIPVSPTLDEKVRITGPGLVGIGTAAPAAQLHIVNNDESTLRLERTAATAYAYAINLGALGLLTVRDVTAGINRILISPGPPGGDGTVDIPGGGALSQRLGVGSIAALESTAVGTGAGASGATSAAYGRLAFSSGMSGTAMGHMASAGGTGNIAIGKSATAAGAGTNSIVIGTRATSATFGGVICLGSSTTATAANQMVVGSTTAPITDVYLGRGVSAAAPATVTVHATGGNAAAVAGAALHLAGGIAGDAATTGGTIVLRTAVAGAGTTLVDRYTVGANGNLTMNGDYDFVPAADSTGEVGTDALRFLRVRAVAVVSGDYGFDDEACPSCGRGFELGQDVVLRVRKIEGKVKYAVPTHAQCAAVDEEFRRSDC